MINIFIYRPDKIQTANINPDLCYTCKGQHFREWQRDQEEVYRYKVELLKQRLNEAPEHKIEDYWR